MKRALSSEACDVVACSLYKLVPVGAEVGVSIGLAQEPQKRFPSGTSLAHDGQVAKALSDGSGQYLMDEAWIVVPKDPRML